MEMAIATLATRLLPGEIMSPLIKLTYTATEGFHFVAQQYITKGTPMVTARGCKSSETDRSLLQVCLDEYENNKFSHLFDQIDSLCPRSNTEVSVQLKDKFSGDEAALYMLVDMYHDGLFPRCPSFGIDWLRTLQYKLDQNSFQHGFFPLASFFNHSCLPNCEGFLEQIEIPSEDFETGFEIRTISDIEIGDSLTICYLELCDRLSYLSKRQEILFSQYGFHCRCIRCLMTEDGFSDLQEVLQQIISYISESMVLLHIIYIYIYIYIYCVCACVSFLFKDFRKTKS